MKSLKILDVVMEIQILCRFIVASSTCEYSYLLIHVVIYLNANYQL